MPAKFYEQEVSSKLKNKRKLSAFLDELVRTHRKEIKKSSLTYIFCTDKYLLSINEEFLKHDTFTDIVTFDLSGKADELVGELYISTERIADNAAKFGVPYEQELHRVIFHGALHLCGYKDKKKQDKEEMSRQEDKCLHDYFKA